MADGWSWAPPSPAGGSHYLMDSRPSTGIGSAGRWASPASPARVLTTDLRPESSPQAWHWGTASTGSLGLPALAEGEMTLPILAETWSSGINTEMFLAATRLATPLASSPTKLRTNRQEGGRSSSKGRLGDDSGSFKMPPATRAGFSTSSSSMRQRRLSERLSLSEQLQTDTYYKVRAAEILLPSGSPSNDRSRVKNGGKALQSRLPAGLLYASHSAPDLLLPPATPTWPSSPSDGDVVGSTMGRGLRSSPMPATEFSFEGLSPGASASFFDMSPQTGDGGDRTPRTTRNVLRSVSRMIAQYPEVNPLSPMKKKPKVVYKPPSPPKQKRHENKPIDWMDLPDPEVDYLKDLKSTMTADNGQNSMSFKRHTKMMQNLHNLRRICAMTPEVPTSASTVPTSVPEDDELEGEDTIKALPLIERPTSRESVQSKTRCSSTRGSTLAGLPGAKQEDALMIATLKDLDDDTVSLRPNIVEIQRNVDFVVACGGDRHATTMVSRRLLMVLKRKEQLCDEVEKRIVLLEASRSQQEDICAQVVASSAAKIPEELVSVPAFIKNHTHGPREPVDEPRNFFEAFASSFRLPKEHSKLKQITALSEDLGDWWAKATNREAINGHERDVIERLMALSISVGAAEDHPYLLRAMDVWRQRIADKVLREAKQMQESDRVAGELEEQNGRIRKVGLAWNLSDKVEASIAEAKEKGVSANAKELLEAVKIVKELRELDGMRRRAVTSSEKKASILVPNTSATA